MPSMPSYTEKRKQTAGATERPRQKLRGREQKQRDLDDSERDNPIYVSIITSITR